jgi:cytochrome c-type biogenesis protein CcmE
VELSPRPVDTPARRRRNPLAYGVLVLVLVGLGVVVWKGLSSASLYFYNADEAVAKQADLGDKRFRLQGTVLDGVQTTADGVEFTVAYDGKSVDVHHDGDPPELFEVGLPVVLVGRWDPSGDFFASDRILVKHSEQYEADNEDRLKDAEENGTVPAGTTDTTTANP